MVLNTDSKKNYGKISNDGFVQKIKCKSFLKINNLNIILSKITSNTIMIKLERHIIMKTCGN